MKKIIVIIILALVSTNLVKAQLTVTDVEKYEKIMGNDFSVLGKYEANLGEGKSFEDFVVALRKETNYRFILEYEGNDNEPQMQLLLSNELVVDSKKANK